MSDDEIHARAGVECGAHLAERLQTELQGREVDGARRTGDLHGVAPAEALGGTARLREVGKFAARTGGAVGIARRGVDLADAAVPEIQGGDARAQAGAGEDAQRVGHLNGGYGGDNHIQHAGGFAGGLRTRRRVRVRPGITGMVSP